MANPEAAVREQDLLYALDIGTRTVIGLVGVVEEERVRILDAETRPHASRAMLDGQIEDIDQVAAVVSQVTRALEKRVGAPLRRVCVAAAGRSLRTEQGHSALELPAPQVIGPELVLRLEAEAVSHAEQAIQQAAESQSTRLFLVGYSTTQFSIDRYPMPKPIGHTGQQLEADVVATFLPSEVVDSLYAVLRAASLEVASLTLEPIAALNAAIPADLRLLNLALVDIGAGTSDIAVCRGGSVVGYTMATTAGDEITEALMRSCLVDYPTAESIKARLSGEGEITYQDILGLEQVQSAQQLRASVEPAVQALAGELAERITALNGGPPSAVFLAGGGSKLSGLNARLAAALGLDEKRIAVAGRYFQTSAVSDAVELDDPVYTTPLGIAISAGLGLISDSYRIQLNGAPAKLFRGSGVSAMELLMMNGYRYSDFIGRSGRPLSLTVDGQRRVFYGEPGTPAELMINGAPAQPSAPIHADDSVTFVPAQAGRDRQMSAGELARLLEAPGFSRDGEPLPPDAPLRSGDQLTVSLPAAGKPSAPSSAPSPSPAAQPASPSVAVQRPGAAIQIRFNGHPLTLPPKPDGTPYHLMDLLEYSGLDFQHLDSPVSLLVNGRDGAFQQVLRSGDTVDIRKKD